MEEKVYDVVVAGGGQSGLAVAYYLRRRGLSFVILDANSEPGGSWQHYWKSLRLFSPAQWSSLPGVIMPGGPDYYPLRDEVLNYLAAYEEKYRFPVERPVRVKSVVKQKTVFRLEAGGASYLCRALISATGSFQNPWIPDIPERESFRGKILHSADYRRPEPFKSQQVAIVGEGNSGAQLLAELSEVAQTFWITARPPVFLPDHADGRYLFDQATQQYEAKKAGREIKPPSLGDIVVVPPVKSAREKGVYAHSHPPIAHFTDLGVMLVNGQELLVDSVIFCTGFVPALQYLEGLGLSLQSGKALTEGTRSAEVPGLWFVGYGQWTGFASATLIGVGRSAKATVDEVVAYLQAGG